ncbi:hypothetical protein LCGC14_1616250 [marine sediment metagenome]|uniref:Uncharacterized protein n=1 Tax=marine sediment metagenome TaxID=412755 RepID=A0A0F9ITN3_9ZZZZ
MKTILTIKLTTRQQELLAYISYATRYKRARASVIINSKKFGLSYHALVRKGLVEGMYFYPKHYDHCCFENNNSNFRSDECHLIVKLTTPKSVEIAAQCRRNLPLESDATSLYSA